MDKIIKDNMGLISMVTPQEASLARQHSIPVYNGVLYDVSKDEYGREIFKKINSNTVVLGGAVLALEKLTGLSATFKPASLNSIYGVNNTITAPTGTAETISLFGLGIGGSATDFGNVIVPDFKQRDVASLVPIRVSKTPLTGLDANKYFFKKEYSLPDDSKATAWYMKEFESISNPKSLFKDSAEDGVDGTEITDEVYNSERKEPIESFVEYRIKVNKDDVYSYFEATGNINMARYNAIGLYTGQKVLIDEDSSYYDYVNVHLFSTVHIDNESVKERKVSTYAYRIYSAI